MKRTLVFGVKLIFNQTFSNIYETKPYLEFIQNQTELLKYLIKQYQTQILMIIR